MRKLGYTSECVEHRRGSFVRVDLFGIADVLSFKPAVRVTQKMLNGDVVEFNTDQGEIILVQAYHATKDNIEKHKHLDATHHIVGGWLKAGGQFEHHLWTYSTKNGRKYWKVERREIK